MIWSICLILTALASEERELEEECADYAHVTDLCLFSSKCTCSEILVEEDEEEEQGCVEQFWTTESFSPNDGECDMDSVMNSMESDGSLEWEESCGELPSNYEATGMLPESICDCFNLIPGEMASLIFNCVHDGVNLVDTWDNCPGNTRSLSRTFSFSPIEFCRESCGLCGDTEPITPAADPTPEEEERECADEAHLSNLCLYTLSWCTCSEILDNFGCYDQYHPTESLSPNDEECDMERVTWSMMYHSDRSDDWEDSCGELVSYYETNGMLPYWKCECFSLIPAEIASAIFNCVYDGNSLLDTWENCAGTTRSLSLTFAVYITELCQESCGFCGDSEPDSTTTAEPGNAEPTEESSDADPSDADPSEAERSECIDIAGYSDHCRYGLTMCTCSELLENTECGEPYTSDEMFHENEDDCDMDKLFDDIRAVAAGSEVMIASCEQLINTYTTQGIFTAEGCECLGQITEEDASVILNCQAHSQSVLNLWSGCSGTLFNLHQRTMITDPTEICPVSCGLCEAGQPTQANNWWLYLIIVVGVIILLALIIMCVRGGICMTSKEGVVTAAEMSTRKNHAEAGQREGEPATQM